MDLYILRHGKAEEAGPKRDDFGRRLTKKGHEDILAVGMWMAAHELSFDIVAASPLVRAQETAAIVAGAVGSGKMETWEELVPGGTTDDVCRRIGEQPEKSSILLVGHEPLLSSLVSRIIAGDEHAGIVMTKGSLAKIRNYSFYGRPSGALNWLLTPKLLALPRPSG